MYVDTNNLLLERLQPFHVSRPTKQPEQQRLRLAQPVALCPRPGAFQSLSPGARCQLLLPSNAGHVSRGCGTSSPRLCTPERSCWRPSRLRAWSLSVLCGVSHGGTALRAGTARPPAATPVPVQGRPRRGGFAASLPGGGCGGGRERRMLRLRRRGAVLAPSLERDCRARSLRCPLIPRSLPCAPPPLRGAMLRPSPRPRRRRQVKAPLWLGPAPGLRCALGV